MWVFIVGGIKKMFGTEMKANTESFFVMVLKLGLSFYKITVKYKL